MDGHELNSLRLFMHVVQLCLNEHDGDRAEAYLVLDDIQQALNNHYVRTTVEPETPEERE